MNHLGQQEGQTAYVKKGDKTAQASKGDKPFKLGKQTLRSARGINQLGQQGG